MKKILVLEDDSALQKVLTLLESKAQVVEVTSDVLVFGKISADFAKMELTRAGLRVPMTALEFRLLKFFSRNPGRVISRSELLNEVWGYKSYPSTRTVDNHIWKLRLKLEDQPENPAHFQTVHGAGYKFVA